MTKFLERMREELVRRNYAENTIHSYLLIVEDFHEYAGKRLDRAGPDDLRRYHAHLLEERRTASEIWHKILHVIMMGSDPAIVGASMNPGIPHEQLGAQVGGLPQLIAEAERRGKPEIVERAKHWVERNGARRPFPGATDYFTAAAARDGVGAVDHTNTEARLAPASESFCQ